MTRLALIATSYVLMDVDGAVLLQRRHGTGYMDGHWALAAAGHVEQGESATQAAAREAGEELQVEIRCADLQPLCAMHRTGGEGVGLTERVDFFYRALSWTGTPIRAEPHKSSSLGWFSLSALPSPMVPHEEMFLQIYRAGEIPPILTFGFPIS